MTYNEKVQEISPNAINDAYEGGVVGCPDSYEYINSTVECPTSKNCTECWNREDTEVST